MVAATHAPRPQASVATDRLELVDALRGFALFGVFWANLLVFSGIGFLSDEQRNGLFPGPVDRVAYVLERLLVENRFMGLFSFLFGISFWLFMSRVQGRSASPLALFYRRIAWLFVIGLIHGGLFWCFDILRFYALWAVFLPLFAQMRTGLLLRIALAAAVVLPALVSGLSAGLGPDASPAVDIDAMALEAFSKGSFGEALAANFRYDLALTTTLSQLAYQIALFGRLLLGLWVARALDLGNPVAHRPLLQRVLFLGFSFGILSGGLSLADLMPEPGHPILAAAFRRIVMEGNQLGLTLAYASALALAYLGTRQRRFLLGFAPLGRMALSAYLAQTAFGIWLFYGYPGGPALMGTVGPAFLAAIALPGYAIQLVFARAWFSRFRMGPVEWCWRSLTYGRIQRMAV